MMRITSLVTGVVLACGAAFGASQAETTTYVDGNLTGVSPNTGGTLLISDDKAMFFRTGLATVAIPYAAVSKAELGATRTTSHDVPLYKVWSLHKRFGAKTQTQFLTIEFKNEEGEDKSMTLELAQASAPVVLSSIKTRTSGNAPAETAVASAEASKETPAAPAPVKTAKASKKAPKTTAAAQTKPAPKADDWWGDNYWKTSRNTDKWNTKTTGTIAPE